LKGVNLLARINWDYSNTPFNPTDMNKLLQIEDCVSSPTVSTPMARDINGRSQVAAPSNYADIVRLLELNKASYIKLIQGYSTAGTYTFTATDVNGDGSTYPIWVLVDGAGGSGAAIAFKNSSGATQYCAGGGASGKRTLVYIVSVTPGATYTVIVGGGGSAVTAAHTAPLNASAVTAAGNAGASSSFNGISSVGGAGGSTSTYASSIAENIMTGMAIGGQSADSPFSIVFLKSIGNTRKAPARGTPAYVLGYYQGSGGTCLNIAVSLNSSFELLNPFDPNEKLFSSGGGAMGDGSLGNSFAQSVETLSDGLVGGAGNASYITTIASNQTLTASSATSPASGGGGTALVYIGADTTYTVNAISGAGKDGQVRIYARKAI
jgi:hypothetical protein